MSPEERAELEDLKREVARLREISLALYNGLILTAEAALALDQAQASTLTGRPDMAEVSGRAAEAIRAWEAKLTDAYKLLGGPDAE